MIFKPELAQMVIEGRKTVTRRLVKPGDQYIEDHARTDSVVDATGRVRYEVWKTYAVCPGRGKNAIGRIVITDVRREPVGFITPLDAWREGVSVEGERMDNMGIVLSHSGHVKAFAALWDSINDKPGTRWADNPDVWVITFELVFADAHARVAV